MRCGDPPEVCSDVAPDKQDKAGELARLIFENDRREVRSDGRRDPCVAVARLWFVLMAAANHALRRPKGGF